jgi:hypothetical protein
MMRPLERLLLVAVLAAPAPAAQDRRNDAEPGGPVAFCARPFAWTAEECRAFLGAPAPGGARVVLTVAQAPPPDPLAASGLAARAFVLDPAARRPGDAKELLAAVAGARAIELHGGTWLEWWTVLLPTGRTAPLALAIDAAHRRGVPVLGTGAGAGFLAGSTPVERATLGRAERNRQRHDAEAAFGGLGLVALAFDGEGQPGASFARDLRLALRDGADGGVHLVGEAAWIVDERTEEARLVGRPGGAALVYDLKSARRMRETLREGRITRLDPGARWDLARRRPVPEPPPLARDDAAPRVETIADPLAPAALLAALAGEAPFRAVDWSAPGVELRLAADEDTLGGRGVAVARARFDVAWEYPEPVR